MSKIIETKKINDDYNKHILDIKENATKKNAELISSKSGLELQKDVDAVFEIVMRENKKAAHASIKGLRAIK